MTRNRVAAVALIFGIGAAILAPPAHASDAVTYEVVSERISTISVEYVDQTGRKLLKSVPLPLRLDVTLDDAKGPTGPGAQVRADWRPSARPSLWVIVRIYSNGQLLCQTTLDVGNATCYGNTPHIS